MAYGEYQYEDIRGIPKELQKSFSELGIRPVFCPGQGSMLEHYAFLDVKDNSKVFLCDTLDRLVMEGKRRIRKLG